MPGDRAARIDFHRISAQVSRTLMRWYYIAFGTVTAVLFLSFLAWIATRVMHLDSANFYVGKVMIYDLYGVAGVFAFSAFVGAFHLWERLTGRVEDADSPDAADRGAE